MTQPTKAPKKVTAKRSPRAAKPAPPTDVPDDPSGAVEADAAATAGEIRPVIIGKRGRRGDAEIQMVTLIEFDDVPYQIPRNPSAALVLRWMLDMQEHGQHVAAQRMALTLLGRPALDALAASPEVEPEDVADVFSNIGAVFFTSDNYKAILAAPDPS